MSAPINTLPPELLVRVFFCVLASTPCRHDGDLVEPVPILSSVCRKWHKLAVTNHALWSHVHISRYNLRFGSDLTLIGAARLWLKHAHDIALHVHVRDGRNIFSFGVSKRVGGEYCHLTRVSSLYLEHCSSFVVSDFVRLVLQTSAYSALKTLVIEGQEDFRMRAGHPESWPITNLSGLVDLQISHLSWNTSPSLDDLMVVLSSNNRLQTLRLQQLLSISEPPGEQVTIRLPNLRLLDLVGLQPLFVSSLLANLELGNKELELRITLNELDHDQVSHILVPFCARSHIVALCLSGVGRSSTDSSFLAPPVSWVGSLLLSVPFLRVLVLYESSPVLFFLDRIIRLARMEVQTLRSGLHTLVLASLSHLSGGAVCRITMVLELCSLHTLVLSGPTAQYDQAQQLIVAEDGDHGQEVALNENSEDMDQANLGEQKPEQHGVQEQDEDETESGGSEDSSTTEVIEYREDNINPMDVLKAKASERVKRLCIGQWFLDCDQRESDFFMRGLIQASKTR